MGRNIIFVILGLGLFASMLTRGSLQGSSHDAADGAFNAQIGAMQSDNAMTRDRLGGTTTTTGEGAVELQRDRDGHFYADVEINGSTVHALVDTGASGVALSRDDARSAGIATSIGMPEVVGEGADGEVHGEVVKIDRISLGPKTVEAVPAIVLNSGQLSLLGQSVLSKFDSVEIHGDTMVLK